MEEGLTDSQHLPIANEVQVSIEIIATAGIDFKPEPDQQEAKIVELAKQIAKELEDKIKTKEKLFEPAT